MARARSAQVDTEDLRHVTGASHRCCARGQTELPPDRAGRARSSAVAPRPLTSLCHEPRNDAVESPWPRDRQQAWLTIADYWRPVGVLPTTTPYSDDFAPTAANENPSAASPRLSSSRTADALLGSQSTY